MVRRVRFAVQRTGERGGREETYEMRMSGQRDRMGEGTEQDVR